MRHIASQAPIAAVAMAVLVVASGGRVVVAVFEVLEGSKLLKYH